MLKLNNNMTVPIYCPFCRESSKRTVKSIKKGEQFQCSCGATYDDEHDSLKAEIASIEKTLSDLKNLYAEAASVIRKH